MAKNGARVRGITIELNADMSGFVKGFKSIDKEIGRVKGTLVALSNYIASDNSWAGLRNKWNALTVEQSYLKTEIDGVTKKIRMEQELLGKLGQGDQTPEVKRRMEALKAQIILDNAELQKLQQQLNDFGTIGQQRIKAVCDVFAELGRKMQKAGDNMIATGRSLSMYVTTPIVGIGTAAMKSSMEFESAMDKVQSVTLDATAEDMEKLSQAVLEMSGKSKYSAAEASEALYYMGLAGWNVNEMLSALPQVLAVATAGEMDLGRASDIVTDYFTAFGEGAGSVEHMVDVMARTMVSSNTDIDQLGDAFKYVAPVAGALGYTIEDVSLALGLMANNGIKASQAGTSLRQFMQRLVKPTAEVQKAMDELGITVADDEGNIKSFKQIMDELRAALGETGVFTEEFQQQIASLDEALEEGTITEEEYAAALDEMIDGASGVSGAEKAKNAAILAGVRGMSGLLAITNATAEDYQELTDAINGTTTAQDIANVMIDNTQGRMEILKHSAENLGISFGQVMAPYIEKGINTLGGLVTQFSALDDETKDTIVRIAGITAAVGPFLIVAGSLVKALGSITTGVANLVSFMVMNRTVALISGIVLAIGTYIAIQEKRKQAMEDEIKDIYGLTSEQQSLIDSINATAKAYEDQAAARAETAKGIDAEFGYLQNLRDELSLLVDENGRVKEGYEDRVQFIIDQLNDALGTEISLNDHIIEGYQEIQKEIDKLIEKKRQEAIFAAAEERYKEAINGSKEAYEQYSQAASQLKTQQDKVKAAEDRLAKAKAAITEAVKNEGYAEHELIEEYQNAQLALDEATTAETNLREAMETSLDTYSQMQNDIKNYEDAYQAAMQGNTQAASDAMNKLLYDFKRFDTSTEEELNAQLAKYQQMYDQAKKDVAAGVAGVSQETVNGYARMVTLAQAELDKMQGVVKDANGRATSAAEEGGKNIAQAEVRGMTSVDFEGPGSENIKQYVGGLSSQQQAVYDAARAAAIRSKTGIESVDMKGPGSEHADEYAEGIYSGQNGSYRAARANAEKATVGFESISMIESGEYFSSGAAKGIRNNIHLIERAAESAATAGKQRFNRVLDIQSPSKVMMESGKFFDFGIALGIDKNADEVVKSAEALALETAAAFQANTASPLYGIEGGASSLTNKTWNLGGVTIQINQQPGESAEDLAEMVMDRINREVEQRQMVYAV